MDKEAVRWEAIKAGLRLRGLSLSQIARSLGLSRAAVHHAKHRHYPRVEQAIATALGTNPNRLWPERYGRTARSLKRQSRRYK